MDRRVSRRISPEVTLGTIRGGLALFDFQQQLWRSTISFTKAMNTYVRIPHRYCPVKHSLGWRLINLGNPIHSNNTSSGKFRLIVNLNLGEIITNTSIYVDDPIKTKRTTIPKLLLKNCVAISAY